MQRRKFNWKRYFKNHIYLILWHRYFKVLFFSLLISGPFAYICTEAYHCQHLKKKWQTEIYFWKNRTTVHAWLGDFFFSAWIFPVTVHRPTHRRRHDTIICNNLDANQKIVNTSSYPKIPVHCAVWKFEDLHAEIMGLHLAGYYWVLHEHFSVVGLLPNESIKYFCNILLIMWILLGEDIFLNFQILQKIPAKYLGFSPFQISNKYWLHRKHGSTKSFLTSISEIHTYKYVWQRPSFMHENM